MLVGDLESVFEHRMMTLEYRYVIQIVGRRGTRQCRTIRPPKHQAAENRHVTDTYLIVSVPFREKVGTTSKNRSLSDVVKTFS
jgi:hypothetical protein